MKNVRTNFSPALPHKSCYHSTLLCSGIILLILVLSFDALAQTPQYYNLLGTSANSYPFNTTSAKKTEHHYLPGEFSGSYAANITKVYFRRASTSASSVTYSNLTIQLAQTASTSFPSTTTYWTPVTTVFNQASYTVPGASAGTWVGFTLSSPFYYDPTKSLVVIACHDGYTGTGFTVYFQSFSVPPYRRIYGTTTCASTSGSGTDGSNYAFGFDESPAYSDDAGITSLLSPLNFCPGTYNVSVNLKNFGSNTLNSVTVNWKWDGVTQTPIDLTGLGLAPQGNLSVTLGSESFTAGVSHDLEAWTTNPNGNPDPNTVNDNLTTSLKPALGGTYTIGGPSPDYSTFTDAVNDLIANGVCSSVIFNVQSGTYPEQITIPQIGGASATNTITFDGGVGNAVSRILQYNTSSTNDFVVKLNGADYIRFKNLTVSAIGSSYGYTFHLTNQANYNQITDCIINSPASTSSYAIGILAAGSTYSTYDNSANNTLIQNNTVNGGYYGIMFRGISSPYCTNNQILDNTVQDFYYYGTYFYYQSSTTISRNTITQKFAGSPVSNYGYGIYGYYMDFAPTIELNKITVASYALYLYYLNQANVSRGKMINNSFIAQSNYTSATNYGIYTYYPYSMDVFYNSVSMNTLTGTGYGMRFYYGSGNDIRNNSVGYFGSSGTGYLLYIYPQSTITTLNYNNYFSTSSASDKYYFNGTYYPNLASLQAGYPAYNVNSVSGNTYYYNNKTDLHCNSHVGYQAGTPISGVTIDFDNQARDPLTPCIGVDEYPQPPPEQDIAVISALINYAPERWSRNETIDHEIIATIKNAGLENNPNLVTLVYKEGSAPTNSLDGVSETFSPSWFGNQATLTFTTPFNPPTQGLYTIYIRVFYPGDGDASNDLAFNTQNVQATTVFGYEDYMNVITPGFSPGWLVNDMNGGNTWVTTGFGVGGTNAMSYPGDIQTADDWVFTPGATLLENSSYRLKFKYRSRSGGTQTLKVYWGTAQDPLNMLSDPMRNFYTVTFNNSGFVDAILPGIGIAPYFNTPNATQTYYVGFRVISPSGSGATDIDNVILDENPVPPPRIGYGPAGTPQGQHIDTQNSEILLSAAYKQSSPVSKTFEVVNTTYIYGTNGDFLWNATNSASWLKFSHDTPDPTTFLPANPFNPPWPRQGQKFTITANPIGLAPGTYYDTLKFVAKLYNLIYPNGVDATNQPLNVIVKLTVSAGVGPSANFSDTRYNMVPSSPYFFRDPNNFIFVSVVVNFGTIPMMTITCYPNQMPPGIARYRYVKRYWQIAATGRDWIATIDFFYTGSEAYAGGVNTPYRLATLRGIRQPIPGGSWEDPIMGTTSISYPPDYFVRVFGIASTPFENFTGNIALATNWWPKEGGEFSAVPTEYKLNQIHPNPLTTGMSDAASIGYALPEESSVRLILYNNLGVEIETFVDEVKPAGYYSVQFDASDLPAGNYYYRFITPNFTETKRMVVIK